MFDLKHKYTEFSEHVMRKIIVNPDLFATPTMLKILNDNLKEHLELSMSLLETVLDGADYTDSFAEIIKLCDKHNNSDVFRALVNRYKGSEENRLCYSDLLNLL